MIRPNFIPLKFLEPLAELVIKKGGLIFEQTEAVQIENDEVVVTRKGFMVKADKIIIATHFPFFDGEECSFREFIRTDPIS